MKCDICGNEVGKHPIVDSRSEGPSSKYSGNKTVKLTMCQKCAKSREATLRKFGWAAVALIGGLIVAGMLGNYLLGQ